VLTNSFTEHVLPPLPLTHLPRNCPLPTHPEASPYLMKLLDQARQQLSSPDGRHLIDKGVSQMVKSLCESLQADLYTGTDLQTLSTRRLVDCLPELATWSKGVWDGIPNSGVEASHLSCRNAEADMAGTSLFARFRILRSTDIWGLGMMR
jgi:peroxin-3